MVQHRLSIAWVARAAAIATAWALGGTVAAAEPTYVGEQACVKCHLLQERHFGHTTHARAFRHNPRTEAQRHVCESCHGPASNHIADPTVPGSIIGFTRDSPTPVAQQIAQCMGCHEGAQRLHWAGSRHQLAQVSCSDCHNPMARFSATGLLVASINETCQSCHAQQRAEFRKISHMPLPEGKMSCVDCHAPHGSVTRPLLKGDTVNDTCLPCHAEKRGPFLWEHAPVRASCLNCHNPHGSNHGFLLVAARPYLCQQCHAPPVGHPGQSFRADQTAAAALQGGTQSARVIGRSCANCHTQVHGSNHPSGARLQR